MDTLGIKEAVKSGAAFLKSLYEEAGNIIVEEVEMDDQQLYWLITFSYRLLDNRAMHAEPTTWQDLSVLYPSRDRNYKTLKIDAKTGSVLSMKIRELQG